MDADFWLERWQRGETGFHLEGVNPWLQRHLPALQLQPGDAVLLPLCGKSQDLRHLADQGMAVTGVELSPLAVADFFREQGLAAQVRRAGAFDEHQAAGVRLLCGDFLALDRAQAGNPVAVFDRAALVALPPAMRGRYASHLASLLAPGGRILLVSFEYPQEEMPGPPFCVPQAEIRALFGTQFDIAALGRADILDQEPRFRARGLTRLAETCWLLQKR